MYNYSAHDGLNIPRPDKLLVMAVTHEETYFPVGLF